MPQEIEQIEAVFPGSVKHLMPPYEDIPDEFKDWNSKNKWNDAVSTWFFKGLPKGTTITPKEGIDPAKAMKHLATIMRSFEPKHEHKEAAVAYLMSLWFEDINIRE